MEHISASFARTLNELGSFGRIGSSDCHNFGITWGCKTHCPQFERGECTEPFESISQFIKLAEIDDDDYFLEYLINHKFRLSNEEIDNLFDLYFNI